MNHKFWTCFKIVCSWSSANWETTKWKVCEKFAHKGYCQIPKWWEKLMHQKFPVRSSHPTSDPERSKSSDEKTCAQLQKRLDHPDELQTCSPDPASYTSANHERSNYDFGSYLEHPYTLTPPPPPPPPPPPNHPKHHQNTITTRKTRKPENGKKIPK